MASQANIRTLGSHRGVVVEEPSYRIAPRPLRFIGPEVDRGAAADTVPGVVALVAVVCALEAPVC